MRWGRTLALTLAAAALGGALGAAFAPPAGAAYVDVPGIRPEDPSAKRVARQRVRVTPREVPTESVSFSTPAVPPAALAVSDELHEALARWKGVPIHVRVVHGETGAVVVGAEVGLAEGRMRRGRPTMKDPVPLRRDGDVHRLGVNPIVADDSSSMALVVEPPAGLLVGSRVAVERAWVRVSPFARALHAAVPLRRATDFEVDVRWEDGRPVRGGVRDVTVRVAGQTYEAPERRPYRVRVPHFIGATAYVLARRGATWDAQAIVLSDYAPRIPVSLRMPYTRDDDPAGGYRGPCGSVSGCGPHPSLPPGSATLDVHVRLSDGRPATGAGVRVRDAARPRAYGYGSVDADGCDRTVGLAAGTYTISVEEVGMVPIRATVTLTDGEHRVLRLFEPVGETAVISVLSERGGRLPFARIDVQSDHVGLAPGGVQLLDRFTGPDGTCRIERMPDTPVDVTAHWAGREVDATWQPGEPLTITIGER